MTTANNNNNKTAGNNKPDFLATASQAANAWASADKSGAKGDALAIVAIAAAFKSFEMTYKLEGEHKAHKFTLAEMTRLPLNENGKQDNKAISARLTAVARQLFGIEGDVSNAFKTSFNRSLLSARYLVRDGVVPTVNSKGLLVVKMRNALPVPDAKASAKVQAMYTATKDAPVVLDGRDGMTLAALRSLAVKSDEANGHKKATRNSKKVASNPGLDVKAAIRLLNTAADREAAAIMLNASDLEAMATRILATIKRERAADIDAAKRNGRTADENKEAA